MVKIFERAFPLEVALLSLPALRLVFCSSVPRTQRSYRRQRLRGGGEGLETAAGVYPDMPHGLVHCSAYAARQSLLRLPTELQHMVVLFGERSTTDHCPGRQRMGCGHLTIVGWIDLF